MSRIHLIRHLLARNKKRGRIHPDHTDVGNTPPLANGLNSIENINHDNNEPPSTSFEEYNKKSIVFMLLASLEEERKERLVIEEEQDAKYRESVALEEQGAVYGIGLNHKGQLGLGHYTNVSRFTVVPETRGGVRSIVTHHRNDTVFAVLENNTVLVWGGSDTSDDPLMGVIRESTSRARYKNELWYSSHPVVIDKFTDEEIMEVSVGSNHALARSMGGDVYVWGQGHCGCLGLGDYQSRSLPVELTNLKEDSTVVSLACGETHSMALHKNGELYSWGHMFNGRLGLGSGTSLDTHSSRVRKDRHMMNTPQRVSIPCFSCGDKVNCISCGAEHSIALTEKGTVYSWGCGDGGRLGHGDNIDRWEPTRIESLSGEIVLDISCGTWHSACIVGERSLPESASCSGGWVYTWGSGHGYGQLGQGDHIHRCNIPTLVRDMSSMQILAQRIFCGPYHNAIISTEGALYTWGWNQYGCLGHDSTMKHSCPSFPVDVNGSDGITSSEKRSNVGLLIDSTPHPGLVKGFGQIVDRVGRGWVKSVACGKGYTIVCTHPFRPPL